jgi:membrane fusion protein (multidrug efflux system)
MSSRKTRFLFLPLGALVVLAAGAFLLDKFGVIDLPIGSAGDAIASESASDSTKADGKRKKKGDKDEEEVVIVPVELAVAEQRPISAYYRASSFVEADRQVQLVATTSGRVQRLNVEEGDWVRKGDVMAELDNDREQAQLRREELRVGDQDRELKRRESLLAQKLVTQEDFDGTKSAHDLAIVDRDIARIAYEETLIRAPFDGQVTERKIVPGQHINISEPLFTLVDFEPLRVRIHLPESVARKVKAGDRVLLAVEALDDPVPATVERIAPVVDPTTSTVRLTLLVEGRSDELRVGGFVKVRITTETQMDALSIPKLALVEEGGLRSVFVAEADSVRKVEIHTGLYDETHTEVLDGLEDGAYVVSLGQGGLRSGSRIEVLNADDIGWVSPTPDSAADTSVAMKTDPEKHQ